MIDFRTSFCVTCSSTSLSKVLRQFPDAVMLFPVWRVLLAALETLANSAVVVGPAVLEAPLAGSVSHIQQVGPDRYLQWMSRESNVLCRINADANWAHKTNITSHNKLKLVEASVKISQFYRDVWLNISQYDWKSLKNESLRRQYFLLSNVGSDALPVDKSIIFENLIANMTGIFASTKACRYKNDSDCTLNLEPDITKILRESRDYDELAHYWTQWHDRAGRPCKPFYKKYVQMGNEAAKLNGQNDLSDLYKYSYDSPTLEHDVGQLWNQLKPFYLQLHAYVRKKLVAQYGSDRVNKTGPIPAHLFGNMWSQQWDYVYDFAKPFQATQPSIDDELKKQNYTVDRMFRTADAFFVSLGLKPMPETFWNRSIVERPKDGRDLVCHASAWDFCDGQDVRIKMCAEINQNDFITIHHEMGHIQYFMQYRDQPIMFRGGANPGFHEAIGDVMSLSVSTTKHLEWLNLLPPTSVTKESEINFLFQMALDKIAFLPFGYVIDYYRWRLFRGEIKEESWNSEWWKMRRDIQGIEPPSPRSDDNFDPAAKYHVAADVEYLRYFISFVIQFQFHKSLCIEAGEYDPNDLNKPLHHCDINKSLAAGSKFASMLRLGKSKEWPEVLKMVTGEDHMNARAVIDYFKPLNDFLREDNLKTGEKIGWD